MSITPQRTMFAALHGELRPHPWSDPHVATADAFSLFVARSSAMGWLTSAAENEDVAGMWGMNDAGWESASGSRGSRVAWFQVTLTRPISSRRALPVQPFLSCVRDVTERLGTTRLESVQILLPVPSRDESPRTKAVLDLLQDAGWFADPEPGQSTPVRIVVDCGPDQDIRSAAPNMIQWLRTFRQTVFSWDSFSLADVDVAHLTPALPDHLWPGPAYRGVLFSGAIVEWSLDALGWVGAFLAEASAHHGFTHSLLLTISRTDDRSPAR